MQHWCNSVAWNFSLNVAFVWHRCCMVLHKLSLNSVNLKVWVLLQKRKKQKWSEEELSLGYILQGLQQKGCKRKGLEWDSEHLDVPVEEVKAKWISLRAQFGREMRSVANTKIGQSTDELYVSQRVFFDKLHFCNPLWRLKKIENQLIYYHRLLPVIPKMIACTMKREWMRLMQNPTKHQYKKLRFLPKSLKPRINRRSC